MAIFHDILQSDFAGITSFPDMKYKLLHAPDGSAHNTNLKHIAVLLRKNNIKDSSSWANVSPTECNKAMAHGAFRQMFHIAKWFIDEKCLDDIRAWHMYCHQVMHGGELSLRDMQSGCFNTDRRRAQHTFTKVCQLHALALVRHFRRGQAVSSGCEHNDDNSAGATDVMQEPPLKRARKAKRNTNHASLSAFNCKHSQPMLFHVVLATITAWETFLKCSLNFGIDEAFSPFLQLNTDLGVLQALSAASSGSAAPSSVGIDGDVSTSQQLFVSEGTMSTSWADVGAPSTTMPASLSAKLEGCPPTMPPHLAKLAMIFLDDLQEFVLRNDVYAAYATALKEDVDTGAEAISPDRTGPSTRPASGDHSSATAQKRSSKRCNGSNYKDKAPLRDRIVANILPQLQVRQGETLPWRFHDLDEHAVPQRVGAMSAQEPRQDMQPATVPPQHDAGAAGAGAAAGDATGHAAAAAAVGEDGDSSPCPPPSRHQTPPPLVSADNVHPNTPPPTTHEPSADAPQQPFPHPANRLDDQVLMAPCAAPPLPADTGIQDITPPPPVVDPVTSTGAAPLTVPSLDANPSSPSIENRDAAKSLLMEVHTEVVQMHNASFEDLPTDILSQDPNANMHDTIPGVVTDPPYNYLRKIGRAGKDHDVLTRSQMVSATRMLSDAMTHGAILTLTCSMPQFQEWLRVCRELKEEADDPASEAQHCFVVYQHPIHVQRAVGHYHTPPRTSLPFNNTVEYIFLCRRRRYGQKLAPLPTFKSAGFIPSSHAAHTDILDNVPRLAPGEALFVPHPDKPGAFKMLRSEQKPELFEMERIERFMPSADLIFDPFLGTGTTAVACLRLPRQRFFLGCEPDEVCYRRAHDRILRVLAEEISKNHFNLHLNSFASNKLKRLAADGPDGFDKLRAAAALFLRTSPNPRSASVSLNHAKWTPPCELPAFTTIPAPVVEAWLDASGQENVEKDVLRKTMDTWDREVVSAISDVPPCFMATMMRQVHGTRRSSTNGVYSTCAIPANTTIGYVFGYLVYHDLSQRAEKTKLYGRNNIVLGVAQFKANNLKMSTPSLTTTSQLHRSGSPRGDGTPTRDSIPQVFLVPDQRCLVSLCNSAQGAAANLKVTFKEENPTVEEFSSHASFRIVSTTHIRAGKELLLPFKEN